MHLNNKNLSKKILSWYDNNKRTLPWRISQNSKKKHYYRLLSEFMLQQTQVKTVIPYFKSFVHKVPNFKALSKSNEKKILKLWEGLGYYSRAKNLHKTSKILVKKYKSKIPDTFEKLKELPGVGDYTAKAILGIGYNKSVIPLDTNVERIIARLYAFNKPLVKIKKKLYDKSQLFVSKKDSSNLIQSFMDYGSLICTPRNPVCLNCNIQKYCLSFKKKVQNSIPVKIKKQKLKPKKYTRAYVLVNEKKEIPYHLKPLIRDIHQQYLSTKKPTTWDNIKDYIYKLPSKKLMFAMNHSSQ